MADLSIIIVSYECRTVLGMCLDSVKGAIQGIDVEVLVIDNDSKDGTADLVEKEFPWALLIRNEKNLGFSKANNIGIKKAKSKLILLLNPDTIVFSDTIREAMKALAEENTGGVGVRMLDPLGRFLPESKRGIPYPWRSFTKLSGLWRLAPGSSILSGYYSNLPEKDSGQVEVLSGAFLGFDRSKLGVDFLLDEAFFMFGEDIDFSFRILNKGFENQYRGGVFILHFKGESSDRSSPKYRESFFGSMDLFRRKHFGGRGLGSLYRWGISLFEIFLKRERSEQIDPKNIHVNTGLAGEELAKKAAHIFIGNSKTSKKAILFDPGSEGFQASFSSGAASDFDLAIFWSERTREFFMSSGRDSRGLTIPGE